MTATTGVLLHPTSLPGPGPVGTFGAPARAFIDDVVARGHGAWQMLPLGPPTLGASPYMASSAFAIAPYFLDADDLVAEGLLDDAVLIGRPAAGSAVDYAAAEAWAATLVAAVYRGFEDAPDSVRASFAEFCAREADWLDPFAAFTALSERFGGSWTDWPAAVSDPAAALATFRQGPGAHDAFDRARLAQFLVDRQWRALRAYANTRGVETIGDVPIFVAHGSADVWLHRDLFDLDDSGSPRFVAGVPPDYFSETGQRWGNPLYRWEVSAQTGHAWWLARLRRAFGLFDRVRVDHFRGFEAYWEIPAEAETAIGGRWVPGPAGALFDAAIADARAAGIVSDDATPPLPIIVEDLGVITPGVEALRDQYGFPGTKVLQFAADGNPHNPHLPANYTGPAVVYSGTHDNDTTLGWWRSLDDAQQRIAAEALGLDAAGDVVAQVIRIATDSPAALAIFPMQDLLRLGTEARMNTPGTSTGNWGWRMP